MSISSVGSSPGAGANQYLSQLLSRLKSTSASSATTDTGASCAPAGASQADTSSAAATGASSPTLSDQVIGALMMVQLQGTAAPSPDSSAASSDPFAQAFSKIDTDGDGAISQSELETAVQNAGGTADEADTVYSALGGSSSTGISEDSFAQAAQAGGPPPGGPPPGGAHGHHHHHGSGASASASDTAAQAFSSLDTNQDGSVSPDELAAAFGSSTTSGASAATASNGSDSTSTSLFAAIDGNGDGAVSQNELATYLGNLQQQIQSGQSQMGAFLQLANQSYGAAQGLLSSASGSTTAMA